MERISSSDLLRDDKAFGPAEARLTGLAGGGWPIPLEDLMLASQATADNRRVRSSARPDPSRPARGAGRSVCDEVLIVGCFNAPRDAEPVVAATPGANVKDPQS